MTRRVLTILMLLALMVVFLPGAAMANGNNGQAIGQDPARLAITRCSDAGPGNDGEWETSLFGFIALDSDCLERHGFYTGEEFDALDAHGTCFWLLIFRLCEVDPGNSGAHNANND